MKILTPVKSVIAFSVLLATSAMAHNNHHDTHSHFSNDSCSVNLDHSVKVTPHYIQVLDHQKSLYRITDDSELFIDGKLIDLTERQQALVEQYHALIQELAPQVAQLVSQGLILANEAVTALFGEMFGDDVEMQQKIQIISDKFEQRLAPLINQDDGEYYLSKDHIDAAGDDLGKELEQEVEGLIKESAGKMLMFIGKMMMMDDQDLNSFEQRMEQFGQQMEAKGQLIEQQANQMCQQLERLELLETELQQSIPKLADYDLVKIEKI